MKALILKYFTFSALLGAFAWFISAPGWEPAVTAIGLLAAFIQFDRRLISTPTIQGRWEYIVTDAYKETSHKGDCEIHQEENIIRIQGVRRYTALPRPKPAIEVEIAWNSQWAELCGDNVLRFDYYILIPGHDHQSRGNHLEAICRIPVNSHNPTEMIGNFYVLPPFDQLTPDCTWGTIRFRRLDPKATISPLSAEELKKEQITEPNMRDKYYSRLHRMFDRH